MKTLAAIVLTAALQLTAEPRPIGDDEAAAVAIAAAFLDGGKDAALAKLHRPDGATWTLRTTDAPGDVAFSVTRPDGSIDGVLFRMKRADGAWRLHEVLTLAESAAPAKAAQPLPRPPFPVKPFAIAASIVLVGLGIVGQHRIIALILIAAGAAIGTAALIPYFRAPRTAPTTTTTASGPLAELSRARGALHAGNEAEAAAAFERAAAMKPVRDDILHEAAMSLTGDRSDAFLKRMRDLGSRDADAYYRAGTYDGFRTAWLLDPKPREDLVRENLLTDLRAKSLVSFYSALEPVRHSAVLGTRESKWPPNAKAVVCGERLHVELRLGTLEVPNGAALAPHNAQVVAATYGEERRHAADLHAAEELLKKSTTARRTRLTAAVVELARHNRWADVLALTDENVLPELVVLRLRALLRTGRVDDARALAESADVRALDDPAALIAIGEALSNRGQWSTAEMLFRSVKSKPHEEVIAIRLRQLELRRALATSAQNLTTEHFVIRHDASINPALASRIGDLLEAELARLRRKFPPVELRPIVVNVLRWEDFSGGITLSDHILGLYDGEILFPFATVAQFKPEVVAVITHELTHAIVAQATADKAPRWFQEGVATRMELVERQENAFRDTPSALVLPLTLLDAVMEKNSDPAAYAVAHTFIRFLEDSYGADAIARLTAEIARGTSTDDALTKLTGKSLDAINTDFRQWGFHHNGDFALTEPWPYAQFYSLGVDPRVRAGFRF